MSKRIWLLVLKLFRSLLAENWKPFWILLATKVYEAEKDWKESGGARFPQGQLRLEWVLGILKDFLEKKLPNTPRFAIGLFLSAISESISDLVKGMNLSLSKDWVLLIEDVESQIAWPLELIIGLDLDGDGILGKPPVNATPVATLLVLMGFLFLAGDGLSVGFLRHDGALSPAPRPPLVQHLQQGRLIGSNTSSGNMEEITIQDAGARNDHRHEIVPPRPVKRPPLIPHYPSRGIPQVIELPPKPSILASLRIESWFGHQPARGGIDSGLGAVIVRSRWSIGGQLAADRAGLCVGYRRCGINYLWNPHDGSIELGGYVAPIRF